MTSEELAAEVADAIKRMSHRVLGVGQDEYDDGSGVQKFETLPIGDLARWAQEESDDLVVYGTMLGIRMRRLAAVVERLEREVA